VAVLEEEEYFVVDLVVPMEVAGVVVFEAVEVEVLLLLDSNHKQEECQDPDSIMDPDKKTNPERSNQKKKRERERQIPDKTTCLCKYRNSYFKKSHDHTQRASPPNFPMPLLGNVSICRIYGSKFRTGFRKRYVR
jgi:hypothetical protein